jgi:hypothetical protein
VGGKDQEAEMKEKETFSPGPWHVYEGPLNNDIFRRGRTVCAGEAKYRHVVRVL